MSEMMACPFCGRRPFIRPWHGGPPTKHMVACENDSCYVNPEVTGNNKEQAIRKWNRRIDPVNVPSERVER